MSGPGVLESLARIIGEALGPLADRLQEGTAEQTLDDLGIRLPTAALGSAPQALQAAAAACRALPDAVAALIAAIEAEDEGAMISAGVDVARRIVEASAGFAQFGTALDAAIRGSAGLAPPQVARLRDAVAHMPERLLHLGLIAWLEEKQPALKGALSLIGLIDDERRRGDPTDLTAPPFREAALRLDRLGALVSNPAQHLQDLYGFGRPDFDGLTLFSRLKGMLDRPDAETMILTAPGQPPALEAFLFRLSVEPGPIPGLRARLRQTAEKDFSVTAPLGGPWKAKATSGARFSGGVDFIAHPTEGVRIAPPAADATLSASFGIEAARDDGAPMILIGAAGGSRVELKRFSAVIGLNAHASLGAPSPSFQPTAAVELKEGRIVVDASNADGFIGTLLGGVKVNAGFDLGALYDTQAGLRFTGSATIEIAIPTHVELGPIKIPTVYLVGGFRDGAIPVEFSADISANLGPLQATVSRLGAVAKFSFPQGGGNAGPVQIDLGFKGPNGVGLAVDAGVVKGGGYLFIDPDRGEYAGALELTFAGFLSLAAVGVINTRMPDGTPGFSLIIIVTAEFGSGIQLGFGFTLIGVGGLLGLNRSMNLQAILDGIRTGGINSIMFPRDLVANAPRIISDLKAFFPVEEGTFLIGPMAKLGWGTPTLVSLSIGIIIEIPGNIAIVGVLRVALPGDDIAVVVLQVSFIGAIEFDKSRAWFFATLYDSRILFITIQGEMGVLIAVGDDADFVLAVGGFHPRFEAPALPFPNPRRIAIEIINTSFARLRAEGYFAVTTNSVQFGVMAEAFFGFDALNVSGHIAFDAMIRFSPFHFVISFSAHFEVKVFGAGIWGIRIRLEVEGPTPWRARGSAGISLLFFEIDVDIDISWGDEKDTSLPPVQVLARLAEEFAKADNWRAVPPPGASILVSLRQLPEEQQRLIFHPLGTLKVSQRFAPLDAKLDQVGAQKPADGNRFSLTSGSAAFAKRGDVPERFAPGQFENLSDDERLSRAAFEDRNGGVELSAAEDAFDSGAALVRTARYELITIDTNARRHRRRFFFKHSLLMIQQLLRGSHVANSPLSAKNKAAHAPVKDGVINKGEGFVVASQDTNQAVAGGRVFASEGAAREWLAQEAARDRGLAGRMHVLPEFEAAA